MKITNYNGDSTFQEVSVQVSFIPILVDQESTAENKTKDRVFHWPVKKKSSW